MNQRRERAARGTSPRFVVIALVGITLIGGSLALRSSRWLHELILRGKDLPELEAAARSSPNDPLVRYYLAKRYYLERKYAEARAAYEETVKLAPDDSRAHLGLGLTLYELRRDDEAQREFEQTVSIDRHSAWAEYMLGMIAWLKGRPGDAAPHMRRSTELDPRSSIAWYGLGVCCMQLNRSDEAIDALKQALHRQEANAKYHTALGELLIIKGMTDEGKREYERAIQIDPNFGPACGLMGGYYLHNVPGPDAQERAQELLERATRLRTYHPEQVYLDLGELYLQKGEYQKAVTALETSARIDPGDERPYFSMAKAYRRLKNDSAAAAAERRFRVVSDEHVRMTTLEARVQHDPNNLPDRLALARLYKALGLREKAAAQYANYLHRAPTEIAVIDEFKSLAVEAQTVQPAGSRREIDPSPLR